MLISVPVEVEEKFTYVTAYYEYVFPNSMSFLRCQLF